MGSRRRAGDELEELARALLEIVPTVMRSIRSEMHTSQGAELSVPQFRILNYVLLHESVSLSDIAEHMGLSLASMSKTIDGLVARGLIDRQTDPANRRKVAISTTESGIRALTTARSCTREAMMQRLGAIDATRRLELLRGLSALRPLFIPEQRASGKPEVRRWNNVDISVVESGQIQNKSKSEVSRVLKGEPLP